MSAIDASAVSKRYQTDVALDRVDFAVKEGETFGFLGPNGAGKSTFINMLLDFAKPTEGSVSISGHDCQQAEVEARERVGVLPQGYSVYERVTGRQHIEHAIRSKGADDDPGGILDRVGIVLPVPALNILVCPEADSSPETESRTTGVAPG